MAKIPEEILQKVQRKYKSLDNPNFRFVGEAIEQQPYKVLVERLQAAGFQIEEDTDPNDDVSFGYLLKTLDHLWVLRVSMIAPYAVILKTLESGRIDVVSLEKTKQDETEQKITQVLETMQITLLGLPELNAKVDLKLYNASRKNTRLYQALFTDTDILPWEYEDDATQN